MNTKLIVTNLTVVSLLALGNFTSASTVSGVLSTGNVANTTATLNGTVTVPETPAPTTTTPPTTAPSTTTGGGSVSVGGGGGGGGGSSALTTTTLSQGNINGFGVVDEYDLSILMSQWGVKGTNSADINKDKIVDEYDFSILMANWGK